MSANRKGGLRAALLICSSGRAGVIRICVGAAGVVLALAEVLAAALVLAVDCSQLPGQLWYPVAADSGQRNEVLS